MRRRRNERDARNGVAGLGDDVVHLEARQLAALARLCTLGHLDLDLFGVDEVFGSHTETAGSDLLRLARQADAVHLGMVAGIVFTALARIAARTELVHGQCQCLVCLDAERAERHCTRHEVLHDALHRLNLVERHRLGSLAQTEEVADEDRLRLLIDHSLPLLELLVRAKSRSDLQVGDGVRIPGVLDAVLAVGELAVVGQELVDFRRFESLVVQADCIARNVTQADAAHSRDFGAEVAAQQVFAQSDALENLCSAI